MKITVNGAEFDICASANLRWADLRWANLRWADLRWANLRWADLSGADLSGADLSGAHLRGAHLRGANLRWANLRWANLSGADLRGTVLDPSATILAVSGETIETAGLEIHGPWVYGYRTDRSQYCGSKTYEPSDTPYTAPYFSVDVDSPCHPGIYLAGKQWLNENYPCVEIVRCKCLRIELVHAGDKFRCKRLWIVA